MKRIVGALLATTALLGGGVVAAAPASAATSCYGSSCNGLDPNKTTCANDAKTVEVGNGSGNIQLRYSPSCRAAWARLQTSRGPGSIEVNNDRGDRYTASVPRSGSVNVYTRMVNDKGITSNAIYTYNGGKSWDATVRY
ncbi:DUF2690 domain-containing protein [Streptomyces sp. SDr-06]|uniref:DUF2690 domain-containing protein n=1 Tax=Streptomyces sp. SDr-06 TaxID=2267702 RepID=UPI000DEB86C4|nr:DUF2690 domain-containing protein [Streptomyces sp. SDr-06]RCH64879.1 DUF2690 domain-containing protein [Streptomyces sp. SDr-06]